jgi:rhodanese-related sulfurtransferase
MAVSLMTAPELKALIDGDAPLFLLDVREEIEYNHAHIEKSVLIPLNQVPNRLPEIANDLDVVVICHHGIRSMQAATFLTQVGFKNVSNLIGGIDAWSVECDSSVPRY